MPVKPVTHLHKVSLNTNYWEVRSKGVHFLSLNCAQCVCQSGSADLGSSQHVCYCFHCTFHWSEKAKLILSQHSYSERVYEYEPRTPSGLHHRFMNHRLSEEERLQKMASQSLAQPPQWWPSMRVCQSPNHLSHISSYFLPGLSWTAWVLTAAFSGCATQQTIFSICQTPSTRYISDSIWLFFIHNKASTVTWNASICVEVR